MKSWLIRNVLVFFSRYFSARCFSPLIINYINAISPLGQYVKQSLLLTFGYDGYSKIFLFHLRNTINSLLNKRCKHYEYYKLY